MLAEPGGPANRWSAQRIADAQDFHGVGATSAVVAVTLGQDDPVTGLDDLALEQFIHRRLADLVRRQRCRVERDGLYAAEHRYPSLGFAVGRESENWYRRANARHDQRGVAAFSQADDRLDSREVVGGVHRRQRGAFIAAVEVLAKPVAGTGTGRMFFRTQANPGHGSNCFDRIVA